MGDSNEIRTGRHCIFALHAHLVFVTKYRHRVFTARHLERMEEVMRAVCVDFECELVEFNGGSNHIHLLVNFPPKVALSKLVNSLKGVSSRRMRQEFPELVQHYWRAKRLWSGSYFAGSVGGAPLSILRQYIEQQDRPVQSTLRPFRPSRVGLHHRPEGRHTSLHFGSNGHRHTEHRRNLTPEPTGTRCPDTRRDGAHTASRTPARSRLQW